MQILKFYEYSKSLSQQLKDTFSSIAAQHSEKKQQMPTKLEKAIIK